MQESRFVVRKALKHEAPQMATVLYRSYRFLNYWATCFPAAEERNWVESQAEFCLQHIGDPNSLAFVAEDVKGGIIGAICGKFLNSTVTSATSHIPIAGMAVEEMQKLDNIPYQTTLIDRYREFLCN